MTPSTNRDEKPTVYSYVRFSTVEQRKGTGKWRQVELAEAWCRTHELPLYQKYADLGVSAFKGKNAVEGELSRFLECIKTGKVQPGSILLVESLDRLSRDKVNIAAELFLGIINRGVTVVTLCDDHEFRADKFDFAQLIISLAIFARANDESMMKSQRKAGSWRFKRNRARKENTPLGGNTPKWIKTKDGQYTLVQSEVERVQGIFKDYVNGTGIYLLNKKYGIPKPTISYWLTNPVVLGTVTVEEDGKKYEIPGHYPAIIDKGTWEMVQRKKAERYIERRVTGRAGFINLFTGLLMDHKGDRYDVSRHYGFSSYVSKNGHVIQCRPLELAICYYKLNGFFIRVNYVEQPDDTANPLIGQINRKINEIKKALLEDDTLAADLLPILRQLKLQRSEVSEGTKKVVEKVDMSLIRDLMDDDGNVNVEKRLMMREIVRDSVEKIQVGHVSNNNHYVFVSGEIHLANGHAIPFRFAYGTRREGVVLCDNAIAYERKFGIDPHLNGDEDVTHHGMDDNYGVWAKTLNLEVIAAIKGLPRRVATARDESKTKPGGLR